MTPFRNRRSGLWKLLAALAALALLASACGDDDGNSTAASSDAESAATNDQAETSTESEEAAPEEEASDVNIVWYAPTAHPYFDEVVKGVDRFEEETGIAVDRQIGPDWEQATQTERLETLLASGANYFSIYPADAAGANGAYESIVGQGGAVVGFGAGTTEPTPASFLVATDVKAAAMMATEALIEGMGGEGKIINVLEVLEDANTALRKEGVEEVVAQYPDVEIIQEVAGIATVEEAVEVVEGALSANIEEVDGIIATGFTPSVAIAQVLTEYLDGGGEREIHAVGIDTDPIVMDAIEAGVMDGTIAQNPIGHGYLSLRLLHLLAEGYTPVDGQYSVDSGALYVTEDNIDTFADDLASLTDQINSDLTTVYLSN